MISPRQRNVALLVAGCFFMENLDGTIVTIATPRIATSLHVAPTAAGLLITSYLITLAVLIPLSAWMTTRYGARPVFLAAIVIFTASSSACAASSSLGLLVAMRVVQGFGGAMMVPVGRLVVLSRAAKSDLMRIMSFIVWPGLVAPIIAPLAGGLITTYTSWRWIFLINAPLGVIAFAVAWRLIEGAAQPAPPRLDRLGLLLVGGGLAGVTYFAHLLSLSDPQWALIALIGVAATALLAGGVRHLLVTHDPLVNIHVLRIDSLRHSLSGSTLFWVAVNAVPFLLTLLFEERFRWSPVHAGAIVLAVFAGDVAIKPATTRILNRCGFRATLVATTATLCATIVAAGFLGRGTPVALIVVVVALSGAARSVGLTAYSTLAFSEVPEQQMRYATALAATAQQLAAGLAIAAATLALRAGGPLARAFSSASQPDAYTFAFALMALVALAACVSATRLHPAAGDAIRSARRPSERAAEV